MYRCKDCGLEYKEKVDYCDCGNNTFDFIAGKPQKSGKPLTSEQKSEIISRIFLIICLIFSAIVWAIPIKPQQTHKETKIQPKTANIPSIDQIWDSTPPNNAPKEVIINETPIPLGYAKTTEPKKTATEPQNTKTKKLTTEPPKVEVSKTAKPASQNITKTNTTKTNTNSKTTPAAVTSSQTNSKPTQNPNKLVQESKQNIPKVVEQKPEYNPNSPEMLQYKGSLRAAMFSKFPVGSISGSGICSVHFAIDSSGKLINRGFTKQSDNKSLNDAVYYMMMSVPRFSPPPSEYNGETISMTFKINNGEYEISIY